MAGLATGRRAGGDKGRPLLDRRRQPVWGRDASVQALCLPPCRQGSGCACLREEAHDVALLAHNAQHRLELRQLALRLARAARPVGKLRGQRAASSSVCWTSCPIGLGNGAWPNDLLRLSLVLCLHILPTLPAAPRRA